MHFSVRRAEGGGGGRGLGVGLRKAVAWCDPVCPPPPWGARDRHTKARRYLALGSAVVRFGVPGPAGWGWGGHRGTPLGGAWPGFIFSGTRRRVLLGGVRLCPRSLTVGGGGGRGMRGYYLGGGMCWRGRRAAGGRQRRSPPRGLWRWEGNALAVTNRLVGRGRQSPGGRARVAPCLWAPEVCMKCSTPGSRPWGRDEAGAIGRGIKWKGEQGLA